MQMRIVGLSVGTIALSIAGCSVYPIPDDLPFSRTEEIVRFSRCEMRMAILKHMKEREFIADVADEADIKTKFQAVIKKASNDRSILNKKEIYVVRLSKVAAVYTFDFDVVEKNNASASAVFKLPWLTESLDAGIGGAVDLTRQGSRVLGAEDSWANLIVDEKICKKTYPRSENIIYPLTGTIGVGNVVNTFIYIDEQGGAKDNFVDELTFTTAISGSASAGLSLDLAPKRIRPSSISGTYGASRIDTHKLKLSLAFPQPQAPPAITDVTRVAGDMNAPFTRPPEWRARYNLCVADARARENAFRTLRLEAPEVYCLGYAEAFSPKFGFEDGPSRVARSRNAAAPSRGRASTPRGQDPTSRGADPTPPPAMPSGSQTKRFW